MWKRCERTLDDDAISFPDSFLMIWEGNEWWTTLVKRKHDPWCLQNSTLTVAQICWKFLHHRTKTEARRCSGGRTGEVSWFCQTAKQVSHQNSWDEEKHLRREKINKDLLFLFKTDSSPGWARALFLMQRLRRGCEIIRRQCEREIPHGLVETNSCQIKILRIRFFNRLMLGGKQRRRRLPKLQFQCFS